MLIMHCLLSEIHNGKVCLDGTLESGNIQNGMHRASKLLWSKLIPMQRQFLQQLLILAFQRPLCVHTCMVFYRK